MFLLHVHKKTKQKNIANMYIDSTEKKNAHLNNLDGSTVPIYGLIIKARVTFVENIRLGALAVEHVGPFQQLHVHSSMRVRTSG